MCLSGRHYEEGGSIVLQVTEDVVPIMTSGLIREKSAPLASRLVADARSLIEEVGSLAASARMRQGDLLVCHN